MQDLNNTNYYPQHRDITVQHPTSYRPHSPALLQLKEDCLHHLKFRVQCISTVDVLLGFPAGFST